MKDRDRERDYKKEKYSGNMHFIFFVVLIHKLKLQHLIQYYDSLKIVCNF